MGLEKALSTLNVDVKQMNLAVTGNFGACLIKDKTSVVKVITIALGQIGRASCRESG